MTADELAAAVGSEASQELAKAQDRITHCLDQLTDEFAWTPATPEQGAP